MPHISDVKDIYIQKLEYIIELAGEIRRGKKYEVCDSTITLDYINRLLDWDMESLKTELEKMDVSPKEEKEQEEDSKTEKKKGRKGNKIENIK